MAIVRSRRKRFSSSVRRSPVTTAGGHLQSTSTCLIVPSVLTQDSAVRLSIQRRPYAVLAVPSYEAPSTSLVRDERSWVTRPAKSSPREMTALLRRSEHLDVYRAAVVGEATTPRGIEGQRQAVFRRTRDLLRASHSLPRLSVAFQRHLQRRTAGHPPMEAANAP